MVSKPAWASSSGDPISKDPLHKELVQGEALSSSPSTKKKKMLGRNIPNIIRDISDYLCGGFMYNFYFFLETPTYIDI
jgi:hypothetical protein